jgi:hypothetical protein
LSYAFVRVADQFPQTKNTATLMLAGTRPLLRRSLTMRSESFYAALSHNKVPHPREAFKTFYTVQKSKWRPGMPPLLRRKCKQDFDNLSRHGRREYEFSKTREEYCRRRLLTDASLHDLNKPTIAAILFCDAHFQKYAGRPQKQPVPAMIQYAHFVRRQRLAKGAPKLPWFAEFKAMIKEEDYLSTARHVARLHEARAIVLQDEAEARLPRVVHKVVAPSAYAPVAPLTMQALNAAVTAAMPLVSERPAGMSLWYAAVHFTAEARSKHKQRLILSSAPVEESCLH